MTTAEIHYDTLGRRIPRRLPGHGLYNVPPLPGPWVFDGACTHHNPEMFFPPTGSHAREAKAICRGCPVRDDCLAFALEHPQAGVWGGLTENQRRDLSKRARSDDRRY